MKIAILLLPLALAACCNDDDTACRREQAKADAQRQAAQFVDIPSTSAALQMPPPAPPSPPVASPAPPRRFVLSRVQIVKDGLAYGGERGVYVLTDAETGREYIGVSGIGITEIGRHNCGKGCTKQDER
jgi:hypothetical protein